MARTIGIINPAEAAEKEALFRRAVAIRQDLEDRSFESRAELAEALAYLGHLLNATRRPAEGGEVMARGRALLATLESRLRRPTRPVAIGSSRWRTCSPCPATATRRPTRTRRCGPTGRCVDGKARLVAEFPFIPEFRAELAWSHFGLAARLEAFGRAAEAEAGQRRSVGIFEELLRDHPTVDHYRRWAAFAFEDLGDLLEASGRHRRGAGAIPAGPRGPPPEGGRAQPGSPGSSRPRRRAARQTSAAGPSGHSSHSDR